MNNNPELNFFSNNIDVDIISDEKKGGGVGNYTKENLDDIDIIKAYRKKNRELHKKIEELEKENKFLKQRLS